MIILIESGVIYLLFFVCACRPFSCSQVLMLSLEQIESVVSDTGSISRLERSTPQLVFAITIWTYMTSHILVRAIPLLAMFAAIRCFYRVSTQYLSSYSCTPRSRILTIQPKHWRAYHASARETTAPKVHSFLGIPTPTVPWLAVNIMTTSRAHTRLRSAPACSQKAH